MKIGIIITIFCIFSATFEKAAAQSASKIYKVEYVLSISDSTSLKQELKSTKDSIYSVTPLIKAYVSASHIRVEDNNLTPYVQISNLVDSTSVRLYTITDDSLKVWKVAYRVPLTELKISINPVGKDISIQTSGDMALTLSNDVQQIAGFQCNLARFSLGNSAEILVWYVKDLPPLFWGDYDYLERVPGLPLKIETNIKSANFHFGILAKSVELVETDSSLFKVPDEYTLYD